MRAVFRLPIYAQHIYRIQPVGGLTVGIYQKVKVWVERKGDGTEKFVGAR